MARTRPNASDNETLQAAVYSLRQHGFTISKQTLTEDGADIIAHRDNAGVRFLTRPGYKELE